MSTTSTADSNGATSSATETSNGAATSTTTTSSSASPRVVVVDMTSDNICPWCYIGKRRLEKAIAQLDPSRVRVEVRLHPFFLDSTLPPTSIDKLTHYQNKFGAERAAAMIPRMKAAGASENIAFSYGGKIGSTLLSHRLIRYTTRHHPDTSDKLVNALFKGYFEEEKDISDVHTLVDIAKGVGLDGGAVETFLKGREEESWVQNEVIAAYRQGIDGVPNFKFAGQYEVSGGEKPETFLQVFTRLGVY